MVARLACKKEVPNRAKGPTEDILRERKRHPEIKKPRMGGKRGEKVIRGSVAMRGQREATEARLEGGRIESLQAGARK